MTTHHDRSARPLTFPGPTRRKHPLCPRSLIAHQAVIVIDSDEFWSRFGGQIEASWESSSLRQYSSLDGGSLAALADDGGWSNEGLFAFLQGLHRLRQAGADRVDVPAIDSGVRS